jgi:hypothetical protein
LTLKMWAVLKTVGRRGRKSADIEKQARPAIHLYAEQRNE